jgi:hypothetical protein
LKAWSHNAVDSVSDASLGYHPGIPDPRSYPKLEGGKSKSDIKNHVEHDNRPMATMFGAT